MNEKINVDTVKSTDSAGHNTKEEMLLAALIFAGVSLPKFRTYQLFFTQLIAIDSLILKQH